MPIATTGFDPGFQFGGDANSTRRASERKQRDWEFKHYSEHKRYFVMDAKKCKYMSRVTLNVNLYRFIKKNLIYIDFYQEKTFSLHLSKYLLLWKRPYRTDHYYIARYDATT